MHGVYCASESEGWEKGGWGVAAKLLTVNSWITVWIPAVSDFLWLNTVRTDINNTVNNIRTIHHGVESNPSLQYKNTKIDNY